MLGFIKFNIASLDAIRLSKPEMIYYGAQTCWWTHDPQDLSRAPSRELNIETNGRKRSVNTGGIPCDPLGGVLFQTDDIEGFLSSAEANASHYGKYGLQAFLAAHHQNCFLTPEMKEHWCSTSWIVYNHLIDFSKKFEETIILSKGIPE